MWSGFPLFPEEASTLAAKVDLLYLFLVGVTLVFSVGIAAVLIVFAIKYRRRSEDEPPPPQDSSSGTATAPRTTAPTPAAGRGLPGPQFDASDFRRIGPIAPGV